MMNDLKHPASDWKDLGDGVYRHPAGLVVRVATISWSREQAEPRQETAA